VALGASAFWGWRIAMVLTGAACFVTGLAYYALTQDTPDGNYRDLRSAERLASQRGGASESFWLAARDPRVWGLFVLYGACFGLELTINNVAATYYYDRFDLGLATAGILAGTFGLMNLFARTLGGAFGDVCGARWGLRGRTSWLCAVLLCEGLALMLFANMGTVVAAVAAMIVFSLFVQMAEGATFSVVPFINKKALGSVAGIVGAGGNMGAVAAGFLFRAETPQVFSLFNPLYSLEPGNIISQAGNTVKTVPHLPEGMGNCKRGFCGHDRLCLWISGACPPQS